MLPRFEMRIRETKEYVRELATCEEIGEEFHSVGAETGYVLVQAWGGSFVLGA